MEVSELERDGEAVEDSETLAVGELDGVSEGDATAVRLGVVEAETLTDGVSLTVGETEGVSDGEAVEERLGACSEVETVTGSSRVREAGSEPLERVTLPAVTS